MRISLNLATRPFADLGPATKRLRIAMGVLAIVSLGLGLGLRAFHQKAEEARASERKLEDQIAAINHERQGYQNMMRQPANAAVLAQAVALNQLFDEKAFSWTLAMEDLETVLPGGVQVSTIEPIRDKTGKITLHLRVIGPRDRAVELVSNLEHSRRFLSPRMVGENSESTGGPAGAQLEPVSPSNRVNFDLLAEYNREALSEQKTAAGSHKAAAGEPEDHVERAAAHPAPPGRRPVRSPYAGPAPRPHVSSSAPRPGARP